MPIHLQCLDVPILDERECEQAYPGMITRRMMCAGYMDGGRDACNVSVMTPVVLLSAEKASSLGIFTTSVIVRVTLAARWCVLDKSTVWCHGVRDALCLTTPVSTLKSASSSTGSKTSCRPTPKKNPHCFFRLLDFHWCLVSFGVFASDNCTVPKNKPLDIALLIICQFLYIYCRKNTNWNNLDTCKALNAWL